MIDTGDKNFNLNININIKNIRTRYQYQYQYCRIQNSISISIPIPKMIKFKLNLKTIPRYLDILRSQANTQKIQASIAQLCENLLVIGKSFFGSENHGKCKTSSMQSQNFNYRKADGRRRYFFYMHR